MVILIGMGIAGLLGLVFGIKILDGRRELKVIEAEKQSQLAIDAQRYDKIREIMTDSLIDGQPAAIEALKPLVEVIASQMQGKEALKIKQLEHKQQIALVEARNQPFRIWMDKLNSLRCNLAYREIDGDEFESCVRIMAESTERIFGISLQMTATAGETKALPEHGK